MIPSPFRWVGGKAWLAESLSAEIAAHLTPEAAYHEPFLGGGAVLLAVAARCSPNMALLGCDINAALINTWQWVQRGPAQLHAAILNLVKQHGDDEAAYMAVRQRYNSVGEKKSLWDAAAFVYLNRLGFNGIHRENAKGHFNVPFGKRSAANLPALACFVQARVGVVDSFKALGFEDALTFVEPGDAVFCDPPYWGTYTGYAKGGFGPAQQRLLATTLHAVATQGARVWVTNSDTPEVRQAYAWAASIEPVLEPRRIAANGNRAGAACVLIRSHI